ncbi:NUDIX hydrolase [Paenibacillus sp. N1-5-1-14]|uniref:NUDIX hydrolase n=1 Tax=Paenibacillus radicibacter TaxID=2972488 RepID=UPI002159A883|nr:NUDIX hydrolase [Paenibacillus radicibacter]MCR8641269.1 NUDIX hydrolase [Paenibacillus radicibacter]
MNYIMELRKLVGSRPLIMVGACVLVFNDERYLLLQKRTDSLDWGVIGGAMELDESLEEAAARELFEETGLKARAYKFIAIHSGADMYYKYPHGDEIYNVTAVYEAIEVEGTPIINDDEGIELRYFSLEEPIPNMNSFTEVLLNKLGYKMTTLTPRG